MRRHEHGKLWKGPLKALASVPEGVDRGALRP